MKKTVLSILSLILLSFLIFAQGQIEALKAEERGDTVLSFIGTTDMHSNIWGYSYEDNKETNNNGMARVATFAEGIRKNNPNGTILVDNGDTYQGTILSDDIYNKDLSTLHPISRALDIIGYDAMVLGNHEYNFGLDLISTIGSQLDFPLLGANVHKADGSEFVPPYVILDKNGVKVAIIGLTNPNAPRWDGDKVDALSFESVATACRRAVDEVRDRANVIIVSAHVGLYAEYDEEGESDAGEAILKACPEIDILMLGHAHVALLEKHGKTLVFSCRNSAREVAFAQIAVNGKNEVTDITGSIVDMADYEPSDTIRNDSLIAEAHQKTIDFVTGGTVGEDGKQSGGVFGTSTARFQPENEIRGIPEGKLRDTPVMDLILNVQLKNSGADVTSCALFKDTSDLPEGPINYGNIFNIYKFDNTLYTVEVTGAELKAYMEWSAACYNQWKEGDVSISFNPDKPGYLYDMFQGVDYEINLSKPAGERIENVMFKGEPLRDDQVLLLAVNNYRYSSALKTEKLVAAKHNWESSNSIRDMIVEYITEMGTISPACDNNWKISGVDLEAPERAEIIALVNEGKLEVPYSESLNVNELRAEGIIK